MRPSSRLALLGAAALTLGLVVPLAAGPASADRGGRADHAHGSGAGIARHSLRSGVTDGNFYFVMGDRFQNGEPANDTGGLGPDPMVSGFDPKNKGFYNGGDLKGLTSKLDYIQGLGSNSIWLTPIFKNKAVQPEDGPSAGYHGYWITDFTTVDPHLGTNADLTALVRAAHQRGMKIYFDIITNHTADVIGFQQGARPVYVPKDKVPYRTAAGTPFDDRDYAGTSTFPALDPAVSFPYTPVLDPGEKDLKVPAWLNDVTNYHNRGNTTFTDEDSQYGDFFGLDDLFTEKPEVVDGMTKIYEAWVKDFGIDGFRIDTMKHVNDEFWQKFGPGLLDYAHQQGKKDFFMFGEAAYDGSGATQKALTSHFTTHDDMQAVLDFPFQDAARNFASRGRGNTALASFFVNDDWYTDADSNAYELPTFLGNHDMGRIGSFLRQDTGKDADDPDVLRRDELAHELMYFSRGNPVVYYGDEQGFTGTGGDQLARQTMFASQVPEYLNTTNDDLIGTDATHAQDNFVTTHPMYQKISELGALTREHPALRNGAEQVRYASTGAGIFAFSRTDRQQQHEYVVALNNSEQAASADVPTYAAQQGFQRIYGDGPAALTSASDRTLHVSVPRLSAVVYRATSRIPASTSAPSIALEQPQPAAESHGRMHVSAHVDGTSFYEVTFQVQGGGRGWRTIGTDDSAPYQVFHDTTAYPTGTRLRYRAVVLDNSGHSRLSRAVRATVPAPTVTVSAGTNGEVTRLAPVTVKATVDPERADQTVRFERSISEGAWTTIGTDSSSPDYLVYDDLSALALGTQVRYRAVLTEAGTTVTSAAITVTVSPPRPKATSVTVAGDLQSELGCPGDWQPDCAATHLVFDEADGTWKRTWTVPGGSYEWKVALNDSWTVSYGANGGGDNLKLTVPAGGAPVTFVWNQDTHVPTATVGAPTP